ncbi:MAG: DsbA family protein [Solirubrobacteraceae bacterium MAG38_C4-C5]|nr:DsbA family protein [Candidatus Siliceabacter maunaloa]
MGVVISMEDHRRASGRRLAPGAARVPPSPSVSRPHVRFAFDLASPDTYLAAERVDRLFGDLDWQPVLMPLPPRGGVDVGCTRRRAAALGMPLAWPFAEPGAAAIPAMRAASLAAQQGRGGSFVLAVTRLAFCGGFALDDPECLAEAAGAAGLSLAQCLRAAADPVRDIPLATAGRALRARGADRLPAVEVAGRLFCGEERVADAAAAAHWPADPPGRIHA